ncbi:MAG: sulfite exporter TauE/SafE family protein [Proteobacteria bacterium]|nr:sulfite exporter TauE/SafE family protein [Pseudomonadota bacterium]
MNMRRGLVPWLLAAVMVLLGNNGVVAAEGGAQPADQSTAVTAPTIAIDKTELNDGGTIKVRGRVPAGKQVFLEVWATEHTVRASRFDSDLDKDTQKRPYIFYLTEDMPAYYKIFVPKEMQAIIDQEKKLGRKWSYSNVLKETGAGDAFTIPAKAKIDRYQSSLMASVIGSRGDLLPTMEDKENRRRAMQLTKARFRSIDKVFGADIDLKPDGTFAADIKIREGLSPGKYKIVAVVDKKTKSEPAVFENKIAFPLIYMDNAGTSLNIFYPFLLSLFIAIFGVLMGAGGGFLMNPVLLTLFPALPHTIVAGTVTPTVLFSQGSGIYNYSKIKFINWKLGCVIGVSMLLGGFIGPKLTELVTLEQYKSAFGWILIILAALMFWQTTPGYLAKNKKEQAIMSQFKKRAEEAAKSKK